MLFLVTPFIENTEDIDYVLVVEANTPEQAKDYCMKNNFIISSQQVSVTTPHVHNAQMHKIQKA